MNDPDASYYAGECQAVIQCLTRLPQTLVYRAALSRVSSGVARELEQILTSLSLQ